MFIPYFTYLPGERLKIRKAISKLPWQGEPAKSIGDTFGTRLPNSMITLPNTTDNVAPLDEIKCGSDLCLSRLSLETYTHTTEGTR